MKEPRQEKKPKGWNKRQTYSPVLSVYLLAGPYWNSLPLSKLLPRGIWMKSVPHRTFSRRAGEEKVPIWAFTWCVSNNPQPFPIRFLPLFRQQQKHHHLEHRTQFTVVCQASVCCSTFISLFKVNNFFYFSVHVWQSLQDSCWTCSGDALLFWRLPTQMLCSPHWETSVVFIVGRIFPEANQTVGWLRLVLWALLSAKSREWQDSFQRMHIVIEAESCFPGPL